MFAQPFVCQYFFPMYSFAQPYAGNSRRKAYLVRYILPGTAGMSLPDLECLSYGSLVFTFSADDYFRGTPLFVIPVGNRVVTVLL